MQLRLLHQAVLFVVACCAIRVLGQSFVVDEVNKQFLLDGQPFRYISGSVHYFRIPYSKWNARLQRIRALGFNAIQYYIPWNLHEPEEGQIDFYGEQGELDFRHFTSLASQNGLYTLLRIGPYICGEWENGGLPYWLLNKGVNKQRSSDEIFKAAVAKWLDVLLPRIKAMLRYNNGPVLMVQIENEYGSYDACDRNYTTWLRDLVRNYLGNDVLLYTTDGGSDAYLKCGAIPDVMATVDFGPTASEDIIKSYFNAQRRASPNAPLVNSEYYPGWLMLWGQKSPDLPVSNTIITGAKHMFALGANINFYMIHGGTNFGFWNGAEIEAPCVTSYDYGAPISEAGDVTPNYLAIRQWVGSIPGWPNQPGDVPRNDPKGNYGRFEMKQADGLMALTAGASTCTDSLKPLSFEELRHPMGYVLYHTDIAQCGELNLPKFADFAFVSVNKQILGTLYRRYYKTNSSSIQLTGCTSGSNLLEILVENQGRQTYETINDFKGILSDVFLDGQPIRGWTQCGIQLPSSLTDTFELRKYQKIARGAAPPVKKTGVFVGEMVVKGEPLDTWIDTRGWGKGSVVVNQHHIGRYWPTEGPQMTLYVPAEFLKFGPNLVMFVEVQSVNEACSTGSCFASSIDYPIFTFLNSTH